MAIGYKSGGGYAAPRYESAPAPAPAPASLPYRTEVQYPVDYGYPDEQYPDDYGAGAYADPSDFYQPMMRMAEAQERSHVVPAAPWRGTAQNTRYGGYADQSEWNRGFYDAVKARATQWMDDPSVQSWIARQGLRDMPG